MTTKKKPAPGAIRGTGYGSAFCSCNHTATHDVVNRKLASGICGQHGGFSPSPTDTHRRLSPSVRRDEILVAAVHLLVTKEYTRVTRDDIALAAGCSPALVTVAKGLALREAAAGSLLT